MSDGQGGTTARGTGGAAGARRTVAALAGAVLVAVLGVSLGSSPAATHAADHVVVATGGATTSSARAADPPSTVGVPATVASSAAGEEAPLDPAAAAPTGGHVIVTLHRVPSSGPAAPEVPTTTATSAVPPTTSTTASTVPEPPPLPAFSVIFDGQSLNGQPAGPASAPARLMAGRDIPTKEIWIAGYGWMLLAPTTADRIGTFASVAEVTIAIGIGGTTDYRFNRTGAQVYADEVAWARNARDAGVDYVIQTTTTPSATFSATAEANRQAGNALVLDDPSGAFDAVVDLGGDPRLADTADTTYYTDGTHWTAAAAQVAADLLAVVLDARIG